MGSAEFGGGGSVKWSVHINKNRPKSFKMSHDHKGLSFRQEGIDEAPRTAEFTIGIRVPKSPAARARLVKELQRAIEQTGTFTLTVPVEDKPGQIRVNWPSARAR